VSALVLSTVGTTALNNKYVDNIRDGKLRSWAGQAEKSFIENPEAERLLASEVVRVWNIVHAKGSRVPAEIASLARAIPYYGITQGDGSRFVFIASATAQGKSCARTNLHAFRQIFQTCTCSPEPDGNCEHIRWDYLKDLQHKDEKLFVRGARALRELMQYEVDNYRPTGNVEVKRVFNITGSYKGLVPFVTEFCNELGFEIAYLYEESERLVIKKARSSVVEVENE
jgi:hypothetical protein